MKRNFILAGILLLSGMVYVRANANTTQNGYETATVVSVNKHVSPSNDVGGSPTDTPLQAKTYSYDIGVRLNCSIYVGRYESATEYLPGVFALNHVLDVRLDKRVIYVSLPEGNRIVKMGIVSHKRLKEDACRVSG